MTTKPTKKSPSKKAPAKKAITAKRAPSTTEPTVVKRDDEKRLRRHLNAILKHLPDAPGVYKMLGSEGEVLYVGKAKNLKKRVSSYFAKGRDHEPKTRVLVAKIRDIHVTTVDSEVEALLLETNLIKAHRPRYNVLMRDDKNVAYLKVTRGEDYPRVYAVRSVGTDRGEAHYYGPYLNASGPLASLDVLKRQFPIRVCSGDINVIGPGRHAGEVAHVKTRNIPRVPCLLFHLKRCVAPCIGKISTQEYGRIVDEVERVLAGDITSVVDRLRGEMTTAAQAKDFERAVTLRDQLRGLESLAAAQEQVVSGVGDIRQDIVAFAVETGAAACVLLRVRAGKLIDTQRASFRVHTEATEPDDVLDAILSQYYSEALDLPDEILVAASTSSQEVLAELLSDRRGKRVVFRIPERGDGMRLLQMARENAAHHLEEVRLKWMTEEKKISSALRELSERLGVESLRRIECYDISHIQGTDKVGSMVVFVDGQPAKKQYRKFKIATLAEGVNDDFASLAEVLKRRLSHLLEEQERARMAAEVDRAAEDAGVERPASSDAEGKRVDESLSALPDLIVIDGGKGQLGAVQAVRDDLGLSALPIVSLAKREEELFLPGQDAPVLLDAYSEALYLVQRIRDESHRFALTYHQGLRSKRMVRSRLDEIPGLGPAMKKRLLRAFGSVKGIKEADESALAAHVGAGLAARLKDLL